MDEKSSVDKVVSGKVATKPKGKMQKVREQFIQSTEETKDYIIFDVLIPSAKRMIWDTLTSMLGALLGTKTPGKTFNGGYGGSSRYGYSSMYTGVQVNGPSKPSYMSRDRRTISQGGAIFDDLMFETRGDAELVLEQLNEIIGRYQIVSVADLYELSGLSAPHTANKFGWTNINGARVQRVPEGYLLIMPQAQAI